MKPHVGLLLALLSCLVVGCSHVNTISMPASAAQKSGPMSVDLSPFWREHGFNLVDPNSEIGKARYSAEEGSQVIAVREKWFKGVVFKYSGGMWATEVIRGDRYEVTFLPVSSSRDADTQEMKRLLKEYLQKNFPAVQATVVSRSFVDLR